MASTINQAKGKALLKASSRRDPANAPLLNFKGPIIPGASTYTCFSRLMGYSDSKKTEIYLQKIGKEKGKVVTDACSN